jgi:hypothetical protein
MGEYRTPPSVTGEIHDIKQRLNRLGGKNVVLPIRYETQVFDYSHTPPDPPKGTLNLKPAADSVVAGTMIWVHDTGKVEVSNGSSWLALN